MPTTDTTNTQRSPPRAGFSSSKPQPVTTHAMDEPSGFVTPATIAVSAVAAAVGMFKWLLGREVERHTEHLETTKAHGKRIDELERQTVTKDDLDRTETRLTSAISQGIGQIATAVGEAKQSATAAHERIDRFRDR